MVTQVSRSVRPSRDAASDFHLSRFGSTGGSSTAPAFKECRIERNLTPMSWKTRSIKEIRALNFSWQEPTRRIRMRAGKSRGLKELRVE